MCWFSPMSRPAASTRAPPIRFSICLALCLRQGKTTLLMVTTTAIASRASRDRCDCPMARLWTHVHLTPRRLPLLNARSWWWLATRLESITYRRRRVCAPG